LEFFPYHSRSFGGPRIGVPSQEYTFHLLREALRRRSHIVVLRSYDRWLGAVPELGKHAARLVHRVSNPRSPSLSPGNLNASFCSVCRALQGAA
jgi:hypothetical protein